MNRTIDDKRELLLDWIRNLDEEALNALIVEYLDDELELDPVDELKNMHNDLKNVAYQSLMSSPKAKKLGQVQSIDILTVS